MLGLSQTTGYAIRALCCVQRAGPRRILSRQVARATGIPPAYLSKLLHALGQYGLILTKRGYRGGFSLARPAQQISLLEIVDAIEGPRWRRGCLLGLAECSDERACPAHAYWKQARQELESQLRELTLARVAEFETVASQRSAARTAPPIARRRRPRR